MNDEHNRRSTDNLSSKLISQFLIPGISAIVGGALIWGAMRQQMNTLQNILDGKIPLLDSTVIRTGMLEQSIKDIHDDVRDLKVDFKDFAKEMRNHNR